MLIEDLCIGDKVVFRGWEDMEAEFGTDDWGDIPVGDHAYFIRGMKYLCGEIVTVKEIRSNRDGSRYVILDGVNARDYTICPGMLRPLDDVDEGAQDVDSDQFLSFMSND